MEIVGMNGYVSEIAPTIPTPVIATQIADGNTTLNVHTEDHLVLHGTLTGNHDYIVCEDSNNVEKFKVDKNGKAIAQDVSVSGTTSLVTKISEIDTTTAKVNAATYEDIPDTIVRRPTTSETNNNKWCEIDKLEVNQLQAIQPSPSIALYGSGCYSYIPQDNTNNNIPDAVYTFGKFHDQFGDFSSEGASGLYMSRNDNSLRLQVKKGGPSIRIKGQKDLGQNYFEIVDHNDNIIFNVSDDGTYTNHHLIDGTNNLPDTEGHSLLIEPESVFIGNIRLSVDNGVLKIGKLNRIPIALQNSPYNITAADLGGRTFDELSCRQYVVLARTNQDDIKIRARDVFSSSDFTELGHHHAESLTSNAQNQIDDLTTLVTNINADQTTIETTLISHDTRITTEKNRVDALESSQNQSTLTNESEIYVDVSRQENYTETGDIRYPYKTLQAACTAVLTEGNTTNIIFKIKPGTYNVGSGINIARTTRSQNVTFRGLGSADDINIRCSDITTDVINLSQFKSVAFENLTIHTGKYGLYISNASTVTVRDCMFYKLGSSSSPSIHNFNNSLETQRSHWLGSSTSNGGAIRLKTINRVKICGNYIWRTLRGIRLENIRHSLNMPSLVTDNLVIESLESAIYLASGTYGYDANAYGCRNIFVTGNRIYKPYNNGILVIGAANSEITNNQIIEPANAGIQQYSSVDCIYRNNFIRKACSVTHNGIGVLGDCYSSIHITGTTGITATSGSKIATVQSNHCEDCQQGRSASIINILMSATYPVGYELVCDLNTSDAAVHVSNPNSQIVTKEFYRKSEVDTLLNAKQALISDGDLTIAKTNNLQSTLDSKQDVIDATNMVSLFHVDGLSAVLAQKQNNLTHSQLSVINGDTFSSSGLATLLNAKQNNLTPSQLSVINGDTFSSSGLTTLLNAKQDVINMTPQRAVVIGPTGSLRAMSVTSDQVGYLLNVTSDIQDQIDSKRNQSLYTATTVPNQIFNTYQQTFEIQENTHRIKIPIVYAQNFTQEHGQKRITIWWQTDKATSDSLATGSVFVHDGFEMNNVMGGDPRIIEQSSGDPKIRYSITIQQNYVEQLASNTDVSLSVILQLL